MPRTDQPVTDQPVIGRPVPAEPVECCGGLGRLAYDAYGERRGWRNFRDEPMPRWQELGGAVQEAWAVAAQAVAERVTAGRAGVCPGDGPGDSAGDGAGDGGRR